MALFKKLKDRRGVGMPTVLSVAAFATATAVTIFSLTFNQARNVENDITQTDEYAAAVNAVEVTAKIIKNRTDITPANFVSLITEIESEIQSTTWGADVNINYDASTFVITINHPVASLTAGVTSYLSPSAALGGGGSMPVTPEEGTDLLNFLPTVVSPTDGSVNYTTMQVDVLSSFVSQFVDANDIDTDAPLVDTSVSSVVNWVINETDITKYPVTTYQNSYVTTISSDNYVTKDVVVQNNSRLTVAEGNVMFIRGNLTVQNSSLLEGTFVVTGDVLIQNNSTVRATIYIGDDLVVQNSVGFGNQSRPTFLFVSDHTMFSYNLPRNTTDSYLYVFTKTFEHIAWETLVIHGGIYAGYYYPRNQYMPPSVKPLYTDLVTLYPEFLLLGLPTLVTEGGGGGFDSTDPITG